MRLQFSCFNNIMKSPSNFTLQQKLTPKWSRGRAAEAKGPKQVEDKRQLSCCTVCVRVNVTAKTNTHACGYSWWSIESEVCSYPFAASHFIGCDCAEASNFFPLAGNNFLRPHTLRTHIAKPNSATKWRQRKNRKIKTHNALRSWLVGWMDGWDKRYSACGKQMPRLRQQTKCRVM